MTAAILPILNATLNTISAIFLLIGRRFIRSGDRTRHRRMMLSAFVSSTLFLISYITYHILYGTQHFRGEGVIRYFYFAILGSHTLLAAVIVPLVLTTLWRALKGNYTKHRLIARWTFPIWLYVSITGVVIYLMLYQLSPSGASG